MLSFIASIIASIPSLSAVYVVGRRAGRIVLERWIEGADHAQQIATVAQAHGAAIDLLELGFTHDHRATPAPGALPDELRGVLGLELALGDAVERWAPSRMIAANLGFGHVFDAFCASHGVAPDAFATRGGRATTFAARTVLVPLPLPLDGHPPIELYRGGRLVSADAVTPILVETMARELAAWLVEHTDDAG
ncbi:MAG TPA: hypothetical protein VH165_18125, partial [Kofleriaceae bacterium]|nr:hypothetical protein [Kofleriaceae bacterium]